MSKKTNLTSLIYQDKKIHSITDQSGHHFALRTMGRSDRFNIGLTCNDKLLDIIFPNKIGKIVYSTWINQGENI